MAHHHAATVFATEAESAKFASSRKQHKHLPNQTILAHNRTSGHSRDASDRMDASDEGSREPRDPKDTGSDGSEAWTMNRSINNAPRDHVWDAFKRMAKSSVMNRLRQFPFGFCTFEFLVIVIVE